MKPTFPNRNASLPGDHNRQACHIDAEALPDARPDASGQQLMTVVEAADYLRVSKNYLDKLRVMGGGPDFARLGRRKVLYRRHDLDAWVAGRIFASTAQYGL